MAPFTQATIVEHFEFVGNNERNDAVGQTFLKHKQTTHTAVAVLKGMNPFEANMKIEDVFFYRQVYASKSTTKVYIFADIGKKWDV